MILNHFMYWNQIAGHCSNHLKKISVWTLTFKIFYILGQIINYPESFNACQKCSFENQKSLCEYVQCDQILTSEIFCSEVTRFTLSFGERLNRMLYTLVFIWLLQFIKIFFAVYIKSFISYVGKLNEFVYSDYRMYSLSNQKRKVI